jgi:hypothetical protein
VGLKKTVALGSATGYLGYSLAISKDGQTVIGTASRSAVTEQTQSSSAAHRRFYAHVASVLLMCLRLCSE